MAVLTDQECGAIRESLYRAGAGKEELKALAALPNKSQMKDAFQAIEDVFETARPSMKAGIDAALGVVTTAGLARKIFAAWLAWKARK